MAQKRMVSLKIIDTDLFLEMPSSTQNLYFHLIARADDDGFLGNSRKIMRIIGASEDDMKILFSKMLVIPFESGVCVIKHWKIHNYIRVDRYTETIYKDEKSTLGEDYNKVYIPNGIPDVIPTAHQLETQSRLDKINLDKININKKERPFQGFKSSTLERDYSSEYKIHKKQWNSLSLPECRKLPVNIPNWGEILNSMQLYILEEITASINNYAELQSREKSITYTTFPNFLIKGIEKYADSSLPFDNFKESEDERNKRILAKAWEKENANDNK